MKVRNIATLLVASAVSLSTASCKWPFFGTKTSKEMTEEAKKLKEQAEELEKKAKELEDKKAENKKNSKQ